MGDSRDYSLDTGAYSLISQRMLVLEVMRVITIMQQQLMVERYQELLQVCADTIHIRFADRTMTISGTDLRVMALSQDEILIEGEIKGLQFYAQQTKHHWHGCMGKHSINEATVSSGKRKKLAAI